MPIFDTLGLLAPIVRAVVLTAAAVLWALVLARAVGWRAFSKATAFDFTATIATGSLVAQAGTRSSWTEFGQAMAAIGAIFLVQFSLAHGRRRSRRFANLIDNRPLLLVEDGKLIQAALRQARVTEATVREKIRGSNASGLADIAAMVLEPTGDITVMRAKEFDRSMLEGVRHASYA
jgi:uncharacterized membrane protein YcaP (DUF421 family)